LFQRTWQFAGFARDVKNDGDYIVTETGGRSVAIQNFDGDLKAFLNVCTHRFSAIRKDQKGNGPLQCQYHGWVFNRDGAPAGIANIRDFDGIDDARRADLTLERWEVEQCGDLVFVRHGSGPDLRSWLAGAWPVLESMASSLGEMLDCNRMIVDANWKIAVENTLESYHVRSVHPQTFARLEARTNQFHLDEPHSAWSADIEPVMQKKLGKLLGLLGVQSAFGGYFHQLVFPALTLATTSGMSYSVQTFRPLSVRRTEFTSYLFAARHDGPEAKRELLRESCRPAVEFNRAVFEEDRVICGEAQRGVDLARPDQVGELSGDERRVAVFQDAWAALGGI